MTSQLDEVIAYHHDVCFEFDHSAKGLLAVSLILEHLLVFPKDIFCENNFYEISE